MTNQIATIERKPLELRTGYRWVVGILCSVPGLGLALPLGAAPAGLAAASRLAPLPRSLKRVTAAAVLGIVVYVGLWGLRGGPFPSSGVGEFGIGGLLILGFARLAPDVDRAAHLTLTVAAANATYYLVVPQANTAGSFALLWKYGLAYPAVFAVMYALCRRQRRLLTSAALLVFGCISFLFDYRSAGLVCFLALAISSAAQRRQSGRPLRVLLLGLAAAFALSSLLPMAIESGWFGSEVQQRTAGQIDQNGSLLLGGRKEPPLSIAAIRERPLTGWGSAENIDPATVSRAIVLAQQTFDMGSSDTFLPTWFREDGRVSLHSILLNAWVEAGVLAAVFPLSLVIVAGIALVRCHGRWAPLVAVASAATVWNVLFSPWGNSQVVMLAVATVLAARSIEGSKRRENVVN